MRIVSHTCSNTEIICALGGADYLVGVDDHSDFPVEVVRSLPRIGPDLDIDIDRIIQLKPDWVITSLTVPGHERCLEKIQSAGLNYLVTQPVCIEDVIQDIQNIAELISQTTRAEHYAEAFRSRLASRPKNHDAIPLLVEWWPKPVIGPGQRSWVNEMLQCAGGYNPFANCPKESVEVTADQALEAGLQGIVMSWCGVSEDKYRPHIVSRREGWSNVPAVVNHQIYAVSEAWLGRPGPRLIQGIDRLTSVVNQIKQATV